MVNVATGILYLLLMFAFVTVFLLHDDNRMLSDRLRRRLDPTRTFSALGRTWHRIRHRGLRVESAGSARPTVSVRPPPGHILLLVADFLFTKKAMTEVLTPTVEDMRIEYYEALLTGRKQKAVWVRFRGTWSFIKAAGVLKALAFAKTAAKVWHLIT